MSPHQNNLKRSARKAHEAIKNAAMELFARNGIKIRPSAKSPKGGGFKGLLYNYFDSKEALLHDIMEAVGHGRAGNGEILSSEPALQRAIAGNDRNDIWDCAKGPPLLETDDLPGVSDRCSDRLYAGTPETGKKPLLLSRHFRRLGAKGTGKEALYYGAVLDGIMLHYMQMEETYR